MSNEIENTKSNQLSTFFNDYIGKATGLEDVQSKDIALPRITILQQTSPQLKKEAPEYVKGAETGWFCDTSTGKLFGEELVFVPCLFQKKYFVWSDSGLVSILDQNSETVINAYSKDRVEYPIILPDGNELVESSIFYCLNLSDSGKKSFFSLQKTSIKASKKLIGLLIDDHVMINGKKMNVPIFWRKWIAKPVIVSNSKNSWYTWNFQPSEELCNLGNEGKNIFQEASKFNESLKNDKINLENQLSKEMIREIDDEIPF